MSAPIYNNALEMIGRTPLMAVRHIDTGPCELFLKLENQNPGGSIKDRVGLYLIEAAERDGKLKPGDTELDAGRLGKLKLINGSQFLLGPPFIFNKDNIDKFDF